MSALTSLRDWARRMAETDKPLATTPLIGGLNQAYPTDEERVLWRQIANEIDAFLDPDAPVAEIDGQVDLFDEGDRA